MPKGLKNPDLEAIPLILTKIVGIVNQDVDRLKEKVSLAPGKEPKCKPKLSAVDIKNLIAYANMLTVIYKDHRAEVLQIEKDIKNMSLSEIAAMAKAGV